ncbi:MAG: hypothetical protein K1000chlam2_00588 [Chlamydiae bacterium]|nr:hypothetical protein [Chlamydiota bacterium]
MQKHLIALSLFAASGLLAYDHDCLYFNPIAEDSTYFSEDELYMDDDQIAEDTDMQRSYRAREHQKSQRDTSEECTSDDSYNCGCYSSSSYEPCCISEPKECIDCECYTPAYYDMQCTCGLSVSVSFLYWYARETNLSYATRFTVIPAVPGGTIVNNNFFAVPSSYEHLDAAWDPGCRVAIGWDQGCDGWDYYLNWTYFHNSKSDSTATLTFEPNEPGANQQGFLNPWINQSFTSQSDGTSPFFQKMSAKWRLDFNQIDLELGRKYWLSPCFTLRPYVALRGAWTRSRFAVKGTTFPTSTGSTTFQSRDSKNQYRNRNWGAGFMTGIQPTWYYCRTDCRNFSLFGNLDVALLWGEFEGKSRETFVESTGIQLPLTPTIDINSTAKECFFKMQPILDLAIGARWEEMWCCDRYRSTLEIGWEHHIWFQHGLYHRNVGSLNDGGNGPGALNYFTNTVSSEHNLDYGGFVIRAKFEF